MKENTSLLDTETRKYVVPLNRILFLEQNEKIVQESLSPAVIITESRILLKIYEGQS